MGKCSSPFKGKQCLLDVFGDKSVDQPQIPLIGKLVDPPNNANPIPNPLLFIKD